MLKSSLHFHTLESTLIEQKRSAGLIVWYFVKISHAQCTSMHSTTGCALDSVLCNVNLRIFKGCYMEILGSLSFLYLWRLRHFTDLYSTKINFLCFYTCFVSNQKSNIKIVA